MSLSAISIRNPVFAWMIMAALLVFGGIAFQRMGVSQLPDVDFPVVSISISLEGAAPEIMEVDVVDPIEEALMSVQGITGISSKARAGSASITVEFDIDRDIDAAAQEIQNVISRVQRRLPKDIDPPVVQKSNPEDSPILWLAVSSDKLNQQQLMTLVRDQVKDRFSTLPGVGEVFLGGYVDPTLRVWLSSSKMRDLSFTANDIITTIQQEHTELPGGRIEIANKELTLRTMGEAPTAEKFGQLTINRRGGAPNYRPISLNQVAQVEDGLADIRRISRSGGKIAVGLGIKKQAGANAVAVAHAAKAQMEEVAKQLPEGVEIGVRFDSTEFIEEAIGELNFTLLLSAILTAVVCWVFLGSWSATLNVILAIPTSIVGAFIVLYALGFTLNTFTLLGLSLAIGIVVDDAIMVLENIVRHFELGSHRVKAALDGAQEVSFAAMAATAAIIAIFLPVAFMKGVIGKYFFQFGVTLSVAVAISLLEALTLTPMRCSRFLNVSERTTWFGKMVETAFHQCAVIYKRSIPWILRWRWLVLIGAVLFCAATFSMVKLLKKEFVPAEDQSRLMVRIQTQPGSSLSFTDEKTKLVEAYFAKRPEVLQTFVSVGGFGGGEVNSSNMFLTLKNPPERPINPATGKPYRQQDLVDVYRADLKEVKGAKVMVRDPSTASFGARGGYPVDFTIRGPDFATLIDTTKKIMKALEEKEVLVDVDTDYREGMPELHIIPDRERARLRGVSVAEIAQTINSMLGGVVAGKFSKNGHRYDVRVQLAEKDRSNIDDIKKLYIRNNRGETIPLDEVVKVEQRTGLQAIMRQDRERAISIYGNIPKGGSQADAIEKVQAIAKEVLPPGYRIVMAGSAKTFQESFESLAFALILGLVVSYMILASQFNSFIHPVTVLIALPFSVSGAFVALYLGGQTLNVYSMIGIILLMGIVKKNSILLVDFTNQLRADGKDVRTALIDACPLRLRPILMTSFATIAGAIPPALAIGPGAESRIPMALAVIGGVFVSTILTLFVVPCFYSLAPGSTNRQTAKS